MKQMHYVTGPDWFSDHCFLFVFVPGIELTTGFAKQALMGLS